MKGQLYNCKYEIIRTRKILRTLTNHRENMSVLVNVRMSKIMDTPIQVGVRTYATYANCRTLLSKNQNCYRSLMLKKN